jgi:hypothetical protein
LAEIEKSKNPAIKKSDGFGTPIVVVKQIECHARTKARNRTANSTAANTATSG